MKILIGFFGILFTTVVMADEYDLNIVERMSCDDIQVKITELSLVTEPDEVVIEDLTNLKAEYRRNCTKSARGRRNAAASRVIVDVPVQEPEEIYLDDVSTEVLEGALVLEEIELTEQTELSEDTVSEDTALLEEELLRKELEQELANLDAGLCADGTNPNKYGCCTDELFKEISNMVFACCPKDGGDCFPPIK